VAESFSGLSGLGEKGFDLIIVRSTTFSVLVNILDNIIFFPDNATKGGFP
jgi:hypothetical protein